MTFWVSCESEAPGTVPDPVDTGQRHPLKPCLLARLGSRLTVIPEPDLGRIRVLPLGHHLPEFEGLRVRWVTETGVSVFPDPGGMAPETLKHTMGPTSTAYTISLNNSNLVLEYRLSSPFCPDLPAWRSAPILFLDLTIRNQSEIPATGVLELEIACDKTPSPCIDQDIAGVVYSWPFHLDQARHSSSDIAEHVSPQLLQQAGPAGDHQRFSVKGSGEFAACGAIRDGWQCSDGCLKAAVSAAPGTAVRKHAALAFRTGDPVLKVDGHPCPIWVVDPGTDALATARKAVAHRADIMASNTRFETSLLEGFETETQRHLVSLGFQSFLSNTWIVRSPDGSPRYSEWEGRPLFHSTLDVVFNTSPFHLKYTPDLLGNMLRHRPRYNQGDHLSHDIGKGLIIETNAYPVKMVVEEDNNFILLHYMYANATGDFSIIKAQAPLLRTLTDGLIAADTDGDGLPNKGSINTFDDAPPSINLAENQLYLGIKVAASLHAMQSLDRHVPGLIRDRADRIAAFKQTIIDTINSEWLGDHYPIHHEAATAADAFVVLPFDKEHAPKTQTQADDSRQGYSNYIAHGLVPLLMFGEEKPAGWFPHMAAHLETAHGKTNTEYGDAHRDGVTNVWISQNMWRDLAAAYLGAHLDFQKLHGQYWRNQVMCFARNRRNPEDVSARRWTGFCESPENSFLTFYSRGVPIIMLPRARGRTPVVQDGSP